MKHSVKNFVKRILSTMFAVALLACSLSDMSASAATLLNGGDFSSYATEISDSQCKFTFNPTSSAAYVILHYKADGGNQENVMMTGSGTNWDYTIKNLHKGSSINYSFTYNTNGVQKDSAQATYVTGQSQTSNTNTSIAAPFGLVVSSPKNNTIGVVWGRGNIDKYNIYINNTKVASGVTCGYYEFSGYNAGTYTVSVTTVSGSSESAKTSLSVSVAGSAVNNNTNNNNNNNSGNTNNSAIVTLYQDINYGGRATSFGVGDYNLSAIIAAGFRNDDMSSLKIASGYQVVLYWDDNFQGATKTITSDTSWIGGDWNDQLSSMKITKISTNNNNNNNNNNNTSGDKNNNNTSYSEAIPAIPNLSARSDRMYFKLNNKTNGKYANNQVYWCILGYDSNNNLCYVDKNGNLVPASPSMNTISKGDRKCANICYTLADKDYVYMPDIVSGRMYFSYGEQVYITFNVAADGRVGYAGPDLNNTSDPNQGVLFEFIEFTIKNKEYWGNTSRVDFYSFPMATRLIGNGGWDHVPGDSNNYDRTVGDIGSRDSIFAAYKNDVPAEFKTLVTNLRIMAPCKLTFNEGAQYAHYYDNYINQFWNKYTNETLVFSCEAGTFRGRVYGDAMRFTKDGDNGTYYVYKPTTQDVLEGKGNFNRGNSTELVIEAQLCAAFNRGVATEPANYNNESAYYKNSVSNFYSGFWHKHAYDGYAYGFCYDDVDDHSTLLHYTNPTGLIVDLKW